MRRAATISIAVVLLAGGAAFVATAATNERDLAFAFGVSPQSVAAVMQPGEEACQSPVPVAADFAAVRFQVGTFMRAGVPLGVSIRQGKRTLASGRLDGRYADVSQPVTRLDGEVEEGQRVAVCIRNAGDRRVALFGGGAPARPRSGVRVDGEREETDLTLDFVRAEPRSAIATVPAMVRRAEVFTAGWMASWVYWLIGVLVLVLVPVSIAGAVRAAAVDERSTRHGPSR